MGCRGRWLVVLGATVGILVVGCSGGNGASQDGGASAPTSPRGPEAAAVADDQGATADPAPVPAAPSAGCGTTEAAAVAAGESKVDTTGPDAEGAVVDRWYLQFVPTAHDGETPVPLVVDLHGYSEGAEVHKVHTGLGTYGEAEGFVTLMPHGAGPVPRWVSMSGSPDVAFLGQVLDEAEAALCVDTNRIYVTGMSNGAMMTSALMCDLSDRFAAAAPVAGIQPMGECEPARAIPVVAFHGTDDPFVSWEGGLGPAVASLPMPDGTGSLGESIESADLAEAEAQTGLELSEDAPTVPEVTAIWAERNGCDTEPTEEQIADDVMLVGFACPAGVDVQLYRIEGGGHTWPGSEFLATAQATVGTTTTSIDANEVMWAFFEEHPLR